MGALPRQSRVRLVWPRRASNKCVLPERGPVWLFLWLRHRCVHRPCRGHTGNGDRREHNVPNEQQQPCRNQNDGRTHFARWRYVDIQVEAHNLTLLSSRTDLPESRHGRANNTVDHRRSDRPLHHRRKGPERQLHARAAQQSPRLHQGLEQERAPWRAHRRPEACLSERQHHRQRPVCEPGVRASHRDHQEPRGDCCRPGRLAQCG